MTTLVGFIEARLDEDERRARAATPGPWERATGGTETDFNGSGVYVFMDRIVADLRAAKMPNHVADAEHIARHDPARVLRDVEAKRKLLAFLVVLAGETDLGDAWWRLEQSHPAPLRLLAAPYSDHPDYRSEWSPS